MYTANQKHRNGPVILRYTHVRVNIQQGSGNTNNKKEKSETQRKTFSVNINSPGYDISIKNNQYGNRA